MTAVGKVSVAASLAMLAWMGRSIVTGEIPFTGDLLHFHYAVRDFYARALAAGHGFDWIPGIFGGYYLVGEGQLGGYHPLHLLLYRMLPLDRALAVELVAAYPFMFAGTWLWMRRWCGESAAAFGAMTATFCGFMLVHGVHPNMVGVVAHVPWLLWTLDNAAASRSVAGFDRRGTAVIGLLIGSQFLLGYPQSVWFSTLASTAYAAHLMTEGRPVRWFIARTWIAGMALGVVVGAVQILATLDATFRSIRPSFDTSFATQYSLRPLHLLQILQPYLFSGRILRWNEVVEASDEYGVYGGGVAFLLAVWWLARLWAARRFDRFSVHVAAFGAIALWMATGSYGKLYYLQAWLPLVTRFRAPVRYTVLAQLAVAVLAARALAAVIGRDTEADRRADGQALKVAWLVVAVAAATAMWLSMRGELPQADQARLATWMGPLVLAAAAVLLSLAVRGARFAVVGLVLLAAGDQALYGLGGVIGWHDFVTRQQAVGFLDTNSFLPEAGESRLLRGNFPNLYLLRGHRLLDGYVALTPSRQLDYHQPNALRVAQVEYAHEDFFAGTPAPPGAEKRDRGWYRLPGALPRVRLVADTRVSTSPATDIAHVDVAETALVTHDLRLRGGLPGSARLSIDNPGDITIDVDAPVAQLLVVSESFHEGWRATIDDAPAAVERVNGDFLGAVVPIGPHEVRFAFRPTHLLVGRYASFAGVIAALILLGSLAWPRQRAKG